MSVAPVAQDDIGRCTLAQRLEPSLDLVTQPERRTAVFKNSQTFVAAPA
jgi:hypothetical protein